MAAGARGGRGFNKTGHVKLYERSGTSWNEFQQINGNVSDDQFGTSLDLSDDGSILVVVGGRTVLIFELSNSTSLYEPLNAIDSNETNYDEVAVSPEGSVIGVTSYQISGVRVFERVGSGFQQRGVDITSYARHDGGIAMNYDGTIVIVGRRSWSSFRGLTGVYQWKFNNGNGSMQWMQMGNDIIGDADDDRENELKSVSITHDGLTVAVGADGYDGGGNNMGRVSVFHYNASEDSWGKSYDLVGDNNDDHFSTPALSSDGTYLAVGAWGMNYVKIFEKNESEYNSLGDKMIGEGLRFGYSVDISADGAAVAVGSWMHDNDKGKVYLYDTFLSASPSSASSFIASIMVASLIFTVVTLDLL